MSRDGFDNVNTSEAAKSKVEGYKKSRFSDLVRREYPNGGTKLVVEGTRLTPTGVSAWNESNVYKDDKGYTMTFTRDSMGEPLSISIQVPGSSDEMTKYIIDSHTLQRYDNLNPMEVNRIYNKLEQKVKKGASIEEITKDFSDYQRSLYSREELEDVNNQKSINSKIKAKYDKLVSKGAFGIHIFDTASNNFDEHMQRRAAGGPSIMLTQNNRDLSGNLYEKISSSTQAVITYAEKSEDVSDIRLAAVDYRGEIYDAPKYDEVLNIETLMKKGYDRETAQKKLNEIVQQIYDGKPLKDIFLSNQEFLTEKSQKLHAQNIEKKNRKPKFLNTTRERG